MIGNEVWDAMQKAFDPATNLVRDLKIDDSDIPNAKNFYDFCSNHAGQNVKMPFARQLHIAMYLFGEVCNKCTHEKAQNFWNVPVDLDPHFLNKKMTFLEWGVCPKCKSTKYELIKEGLLKDYTELVLIGGQRLGKCVTEDTLVQTSKGLMTFGQLNAIHSDTKDTYGFVDYKGPNLVNENGKQVRPNKFYREKPVPLLEVTMGNGMVIRGTPNHPIWTLEGWTKLKDLRVGQELPIKVGQDTWAKRAIELNHYHAKASAIFEHGIKQVKAVHTDIGYPQGKLTEDVARLLGYWISEGSAETSRHFCVNNTDMSVLEDCANVLSALFPGLHTGGYKHKRVGFVNAKAASFLDALLDEALSLGVRSADKFIPSCILQSPKPVVVAFLSALYEGDGGINGQRIDYYTISKTLARQVQVLLSNLGIVCRTKPGWTWATNGSTQQVSKRCYSVVIEGHRNMEAFQTTVGFISERKKQILKGWLRTFETKKKQMPSRTDKLPAHIRSAWLNLVTDVGSHLNTYEFLDTWGRKHRVGLPTLFGRGSGKGRASVCITRNTVRECYAAALNSPFFSLLTKEQKMEFKRLNSIACDEYTSWTAVVSIKKVRAEPTYDVCIPEGHRFMANGLLNHNSTLTAAMVAYALHRMLKAPKLSSIARGIQDFTPLVGSFVALTVTKATSLLWNPIRDMISASKWFEDYFKMLDFYGKKYGREFYQFKPTGTYLRMFHKNIDMLPEGPSKRTLRGSTRWISATDELGHFPFDAKSDQDDFDDERERANADEVHQVITNSLATVRTEVMSFYPRGIFTVPQALNLSISSPASWKDKICRLYKEAEHSDQMLAIKAATWEVSPIFTRDHPIIADMYRRNPRKAERDFGANPPSLSSTVFNKDTILPLFCLDPLYAVNYDNTVDKTRGKAVELTHPAVFYPSIMGLDAGYTNNAFGLTVTYQTPDGLVKCPIAIEVIPAAGKKIDFVYLYANVIKPIIKACNVKAVVADRWNSIHVLQSIETDSPSVKTAIYSLRAKDFSAFTELVGAGQLLLPKLELPPDRIEVVTDFKKDLMRFPASHLYLQFLTVQEIQGVLEKGSGYTDDIFRSLVISTRHHFDKRITEHLAQYKPIEREAMSLDSIIIVSGRSMGMYR